MRHNANDRQLPDIATATIAAEYSRPLFPTNPSPEKAYRHTAYVQTLRYLQVGMASTAKVSVLTGIAGVGKTTLLMDLLGKASLGRSARWISAQLSGDEFLRACGLAFGAELQGLGIGAMLDELELVLLRNGSDASVLVVDDAHLLPDCALLRLQALLMRSACAKRLQHSFLVGQLALEQQLQKPQFDQLRSQCAPLERLEPFSADDCACYLRARLAALGDDVCELIHRASGGTPLGVHLLANRLLIAADMESKQKLDLGDVQRSLDDLCNEGLLDRVVSPNPEWLGRGCLS